MPASQPIGNHPVHSLAKAYTQKGMPVATSVASEPSLVHRVKSRCPRSRRYGACALASFVAVFATGDPRPPDGSARMHRQLNTRAPLTLGSASSSCSMCCAGLYAGPCT